MSDDFRFTPLKPEDYAMAEAAARTVLAIHPRGLDGNGYWNLARCFLALRMEMAEAEHYRCQHCGEERP